MALWILLICATTLTAIHAKGLGVAGPYRVITRYTTNQSEDFTSTGKIWVHSTSTTPKPRQAQYHWGESFNSVPISDDLKIDLHVSQWVNNQWKKNALVMKFDKACSSCVNQVESLMVAYFGEAGRKCPIPVGHRIMKNHSFDVTFPRVPVAPYGRWLYHVRFLSGSETVGLLVTESQTVPKL